MFNLPETLCLFLAILATISAVDQQPARIDMLAGRIRNGRIYENPSLEMRIVLPGLWQLKDRRQESVVDSRTYRFGCVGPLCGAPDVAVSLRSADGGTSAIFLDAYRLSGEYRDRKRHPLRRFAEVMTKGSLGTKWIPEGDLATIQLAGKPSFKLTARNVRRPSIKSFLYVGDAKDNNYVFLIVATSTSDSNKLEQSIERMSSPASFP